MNNQRTLPVFQIRQTEGVPSAPNKVEFEGDISNRNLDAYYTRMSDETLRNFARDARNGVAILGNHDYTSALLGKSKTGYFNRQKGTVRSRFDIQRGLSTPNALYGTSDDFIEAIKGGTLTDISVGFSEHTEICDVCNEEIRGNMFWASDKNGHYPGKKIYLDKQGNEVSEPGKGIVEKVVTATIKGGKLLEYSVVWEGATPGAEITEKVIRAYQDGELNEEKLDFIRCRYGSRAHRHFIDTINKLEPKRQTKYFGGFNMSFSEERIQEMIAQETQETREDQAAALQQVVEQRDAFALKLDEVGDVGTIEANQHKASERIKELEEELRSVEHIVAEHEQIMATMRKSTMSQFDRKFNYAPDAAEREVAEKEVNNCNSYYLLRQLYDAYKESADARAAVRSVGRQTVDYDGLGSDRAKAEEMYTKAKVTGSNSYA